MFGLKRPLFGPGGLLGPHEVIPNPEFDAPPPPIEHSYGPPNVRTTDEWGRPDRLEQDDFFAPELASNIERVRHSFRQMTDDEIEDLLKEVLGRTYLLDIKRLAARLRLWAFRTP